MWNFDGVACAAALELGRPFFFFHADHLVYGFMGYLFWNGVALPLGMSRALPALQLLTSLFSALGLVALYRLFNDLLQDKIVALLLTLSMSVTAVFWVWSIEAQVYSLGFLALAWATVVLCAGQSPNKSIWVGLLHGAAVLGHLMHVLWMIPALYWMWDDSRANAESMTKTFFQYGVALGSSIVIPYAWVLARVIVPGHDRTHILFWLRGSAGLSPDRSWQWHFAGWSAPWVWLKSSASIFWGCLWPYDSVAITRSLWILFAFSALVVLALIARGVARTSEKMIRFCLLWVAVYGIFLWTWEPATLCYRMIDVIPLGIVMAVGLKTYSKPTQLFMTVFLLASLLMINAVSLAGPMHHSERNIRYQESLRLSKMTPVNSLYVTQDPMLWLYLLYFTGRTAWNQSTTNAPILAAELERQKRVRPVYMLKGTTWQQLQ